MRLIYRLIDELGELDSEEADERMDIIVASHDHVERLLEVELGDRHRVQVHLLQHTVTRQLL